MSKIYNIPKILEKKLLLKKGSKSHEDYETAKKHIHYLECDKYDYETYLRQAAEYLGV